MLLHTCADTAGQCDETARGWATTVGAWVGWTLLKLGLFFSGLAGGGTQRRMLTLAGGFIDRGHEVSIVVASAAGPFRAAAPLAARIVDLGGRGHALPIFRRGRGLWVPLVAGRLASWLRHERPEALLASSTPANLVAALACRKAAPEMPLVLTLNLPPSSVAAAVGPLRRPLLRLMRLAYRRADGLIANTKGIAADAATTLRIPIERIAVVANPVNVAMIASQAEATVTHPWFDAGAPPVVISVGKLQPQKDLPTLLRAFASVRAVRPARLVILGEGRMRASLERLVVELGLADDVALPGFAANPFAWMARSACVVSSSRFEGFSNVLAEALAVGATIVSTDCPEGPREVLADGAFGRLVPVGNPEALGGAIVAALDRPADPARQRARALQFSAEAAVDGYLANIAALVLRRAGALAP